MNSNIADSHENKRSDWMLYGCYGYSGELILEEAIKKGLRPILAGRNDKKTRQLAEKYHLPYRAFDLSCAETIERNISDCFMVFNAAGPYSSTCIPLLKACIKQGVHNLSLAGEIPILEELHGYDKEAQDSNIVIAVGLGFDVMPTDALAARVIEEMPDASHLTIGLDGPNDMSRGSMKEFFEQIGEQPFWIRSNGKLVESKPKTKQLDFGNGKKLASSIAWGDTASAYHSTGIPNIEVYSAVSYSDWLLIKSLNAFSFLFKSKGVQTLLNKCIDKLLSGPNEKEREQRITYLCAEASNVKGDKVKINMTTPSSYKITYLGAVHAIEYMIQKPETKGGYYTPAQLLSYQGITKIEGVSEMTVISSKHE